MDKNALKRRNRLLKKNESRMKALLGKSIDDDISQNNNNENYNNYKIDKKKCSDNSDENEKIEKGFLYNTNEYKKSICENIRHEKNNDTFNAIENNFNNSGNNEKVDKKNYEEKMKNKNIDNKIEEEEEEDYLGNKKEKSPSYVDSNNNENILFSILKEKNINNNSLKESFEFNINNMKKLYFTLLIIISIFFSVIKLKYNNIFLADNILNNTEKIFLYFIKSKHFFIWFSIIYNLIFLLIDICIHFINNKISKKDLIGNIKNIKKKLSDESEFFLFILNNISKVILFLINIIKSYVISMFLTHLFEDIFFNNIFYISSMNIDKTKYRI